MTCHCEVTVDGESEVECRPVMIRNIGTQEMSIARQLFLDKLDPHKVHFIINSPFVIMAP